MRTRLHSPFIPTLLALAILGGCQGDDKTAVAPEQAQGPQATETATTSADAVAETQRLTEWFNERYEEQLQFSPIQLSYLGRKELYDQIDDMSEAADEKELAWKAETVRELKEQFDYDKLTTAGKESYDLWVFQYEQAKANKPFWGHSYFASELYGPEASLPTFLINQHKVDTVEDMQAYIARIGGVSRAMKQLLERAQRSAQEGIRPPRFAYDLAVERAQKVITGQPFGGEEDSPLLADARGKIKSLQEDGKIDEKQAGEMLAKVEKSLNEEFKPAYEAYIAWVQEDSANASEEPKGASSLPNGEAYYNNRLANYTTLELTADQVHQIGLDEVARIRKEMEGIKDQVNFDGTLQEFFTFIRTDDQFYYPNTDEGREGYLAETRGFLDDIEKKLPQYFGILPKAGLEVKRVEAFREVPGGAQHYQSGTPDGSRPGVYYVHMSDMSALSTTDMETVTYHEGSPGHHMQISIAQELENIPKFRTQAHFTPYIEGWALYSEKLAKEMGQFEDPYKDFGRLTAEMWRAIRLVVDTGMHAKGWSQDQAVEYFLENSAIPEGAVRSEVRRYLTLPGQATSYKIGMLKILELREKAKETLGEKFDIRGFHDTILGGGALPLPMLEKRVNRWIEGVQQS
ncbi:DUF885 domain-containing protein [Microbulbifer yueqingensis]|uniref:Uncharacterized conserved protein, DUF885 familyt n=1 Tax=Microbulbifer yueqingensis TaxID=658219 RepID=A0A1G9BDK4_9GAMM|nr:DUF885 domain-containing protein [Microbulbifer yueqingensis]SDK37154.1 Uncharacterized conserved protein, DUF885 familyt [Microbulbifer yueqingensis]